MSDQLPTRRYASAGGVVVDPENELVLVLVRQKRLGPNGQPEIRLPKGHIDPGEDRKSTALREVDEEAGLANLEIAADLGHQVVEFQSKGFHYIRDESYFLMMLTPATHGGKPEKQFQRLWLSWEEAMSRMTFEAELEWVRRARLAYATNPQMSEGESAHARGSENVV